MSVGPEVVASFPALLGSEGELVSVRICVEPRGLELLLETLAELSFPVNPQIYHEAGLIRTGPDGRDEILPVTLVEFPAFSGRVAEVKRALTSGGLRTEAFEVRSMLDELSAEGDLERLTATDGQSRLRIYRRLASS